MCTGSDEGGRKVHAGRVSYLLALGHGGVSYVRQGWSRLVSGRFACSYLVSPYVMRTLAGSVYDGPG